MEQNTIQIQHINLECPIAEFGFNRFLLTFFIRYRVLNSNAFSPGIGPQPLRFTALFFDHVAGSPNCWTSNRPAWSKIEGRLQISKCWNLLIRTARWVVPQTRVLQRSNNQKHFHRTFIKSVHVGRLFIGCRNRPTLLQSVFSSFVSLGSYKTTLNTHTPSSCQAPVSPSDLWTCYVCVSIHSSAFFLMGS